MTITPGESVPVGFKDRILVVDILRGFAILGILLFNMKSFSGQAYIASSWDGPLDRAVVILLDFFVQAKFYSLFSFLFGWGLAVQIRRAEEKGLNFLPAYLRRLLILLIFGALHSIFLWTGDILFMYAIIGFMMVLIFRKSSPRTLLTATFILLLSRIIFTLPGNEMAIARDWCYNFTRCWTPDTILPTSLYSTGSYWDVTRLRFQETLNGIWWFPCYIGNVFAMMLLGLYTGKRRLFANLDQHQNLFQRVMWAGLIIGVTLNGIFAYLAIEPITDEIRRLIAISARTFGAPALMLFYVTAITRLFQRPKWQARLAPLALVGRMALTNYITHSFFLTLFFYGYGLGIYGVTGPTFGLILTLLVYRGQIEFSKWWFEKYRFGPLEWLWRTLTYNIRLPISIKRKIDALSGKGEATRRRQPYFLAALTAVFIPVAIFLIYQGLNRESADLPVDPGADQGVVDITVEEGLLGEEQTEEKYAPAFLAGIQISRVAIPEMVDMGSITRTISGESALVQIEELASENYQGRYSGTPGGQSAGEYISELFDAYGLIPVGDQGSYQQVFPLKSLVLDEVPQLNISAADGSMTSNYGLHQDFVPVLGGYAGANQGAGDLIWAVDCSAQDFHDLEIVGKIVFCRSGDIEQQTRQAAKNGAIGLLLYTIETDQPPAYRSPLFKTWIPEPIPVIQIYDRPAADLLAGTGYTLSDLTIIYQPTELETRVEMAVQAKLPCDTDPCLGHNILGLLPGWDPAYADQVIVISANYDGLGASPDGKIWAGANWNASGVGALLEIARSWHENNYQPRTTVLFALWDAHEQGEIGFEHFLASGIYPLQDTAAFIYLNGVGSGNGPLLISGDNFSGQADAAAGTLGIETIRNEVPSNFGKWIGDSSFEIIEISWMDAEQNRGLPEDNEDRIQTDRLEDAARTAGLVAMQLSDLPGAIDELLTARCEAIVTDDLSGFLGTTDLNRIKEDRSWFERIRSLSPESCDAAAINLLTTLDTAQGRIEYQISYPAAAQDETVHLRIQTTAKFQQSRTGWKWVGPDQIAENSARIGSTSLDVYRPATSSDDYHDIGYDIINEYRRITSILSLSAELDAEVQVYPDRETMISEIDPISASRPTEWIEKNTLMFSSNPNGDQERLNIATVHFMLEKYGVPGGSFTWLQNGLPLLLDDTADGITIQSDRLYQFHTQLKDSSIAGANLGSWAALAYLQKTQGWEAIGELIINLGAYCQKLDCKNTEGADLALTATLGMDQEGFNSAWQAYWLNELDKIQENIDQVLNDRTTAILNGNENQFLKTVDGEIPNFSSEESYWFSSLSGYSLDTFQLTGIPLTIFDDGSVLVRVTIQFRLDDTSTPGSRGSLPVEILFSSKAGKLSWAGPVLESLENGQITVRYPKGYQDKASIVQRKALDLYSEIATKLNISNPPPLIINLYEDSTLYRTSISLTYPVSHASAGWSAPEQAIKLLIDNQNEQVVDRQILIRHLSRSLISSLGVDDPWLLNGGSLYFADNIDGTTIEKELSSALLLLNSFIRHEQDFDLGDFPIPDELEENDFPVALAQAWDSINFLAETYGEQTLLDLLKTYQNFANLDQAIQAAIDRSISEFGSDWKESFSLGHIQPGTLETSQRFDPEQAIKHITVLTSPEMAGRQAGLEGSLFAAKYIAGKFSEYGLVVEEQKFEIPVQTYLQKPVLSLEIDGSTTDFIYREDFLILAPGDIPDGLTGELIWVSDRDYSGMDLDGKIAVRKPTLSIQEEVGAAQESGASALILIGSKKRPEDVLAKYPLLGISTADQIPVIEFTKAGFNHLLELTGQNQGTLAYQNPAATMGAKAYLRIISSPLESLAATNLIGILPGVNPELKDEVIILAAHYDHVGDEFGTQYSGANDNASGVAVLLEIARLWKDSGYQSERTVLLIAWDAQENGELGSRHYVINPLFPLENTMAVLNIDAVGGGEGFYLEATGLREEDGWLLLIAQKAGKLADTRLITTGNMDTRTPNPDWLFSPGYMFDYYNIAATSDDLPFREVGIPTLLFRWKGISEKNLPDYLADEVLLERLATSGITISTAAMILAR